MTKILLVDDDVDTLNLIVNCLSESGYDVFTARDGLEGLQKFAENNIELVITDILMPGMDGVALIENIRNCSNEKHVPAIAIATNPCLPEFSPFDAFFRKPIAIEILIHAIELGTRNGRK